jgi:gas vesicle protein
LDGETLIPSEGVSSPYGIRRIEREESNMSRDNGGFGTFFAGFLMGGAVGAGIAFLTAPRSGEETRQQIRAKGVEVRDAAEQTVDEALVTVKNAALDVSSRTEELRAQSQAVLDEAQTQWAEATKDIKQVALEAIEEMRTTAAEAAKETAKATAETE